MGKKNIRVMGNLKVQSIKTRTFNVGEPLVPFLLEHLPSQLENTVLAITSKIVSLSEGRIVKKSQISKEELVKKEADHFLGETSHGIFLTIKHGLLIPSAGIDESNAAGDYFILYPEDPEQTAESVRKDLCKKFNLKNFGIILTDSVSSPLRLGVTGVALSHSGFLGIKSEIGKNDLFGHPLKVTKVNVADSLASAAVHSMGEGNESTPLAVIKTGLVEFVQGRVRVNVAPEEDIYFPLYKNKMPPDIKPSSGF